MNLKPFVSSNFLAALIKPKLPSLMRSLRGKLLFWYCLATETTNLKLDFTNFSNARSSPCLIRCASSTSSSGVIIGTLLTSVKYFSKVWLSRLLVMDCVILSCLMCYCLVIGDENLCA